MYKPVNGYILNLHPSMEDDKIKKYLTANLFQAGEIEVLYRQFPDFKNRIKNMGLKLKPCFSTHLSEGYNVPGKMYYNTILYRLWGFAV